MKTMHFFKKKSVCVCRGKENDFNVKLFVVSIDVTSSVSCWCKETIDLLLTRFVRPTAFLLYHYDCCELPFVNYP